MANIELHRFIESWDSRETSREIMLAIAWLAEGDVAEAERIWKEPTRSETRAVFALVSDNGRRDPEQFSWGIEGANWCCHLKPVWCE